VISAGSIGIADLPQRLAPDMTAAAPFDPHALLAESRLGVLATVKSDGRPQLSPVMPFYDRAAGLIYVSEPVGEPRWL
jgi:hypothetical protein